MAEIDQQKIEKSKDSAWWQPAVFMFLRLSVWIAGPLIVALFLGSWLESRYGLKPWLSLAAIGLAFVVSMIGIVRVTIKEIKKIP